MTTNKSESKTLKHCSMSSFNTQRLTLLRNIAIGGFFSIHEHGIQYIRGRYDRKNKLYTVTEVISGEVCKFPLMYVYSVIDPIPAHNIPGITTL